MAALACCLVLSALLGTLIISAILSLAVDQLWVSFWVEEGLNYVTVLTLLSLIVVCGFLSSSLDDDALGLESLCFEFLAAFIRNYYYYCYWFEDCFFWGEKSLLFYVWYYYYYYCICCVIPWVVFLPLWLLFLSPIPTPIPPIVFSAKAIWDPYPAVATLDGKVVVLALVLFLVLFRRLFCWDWEGAAFGWLGARREMEGVSIKRVSVMVINLY